MLSGNKKFPLSFIMFTSCVLSIFLISQKLIFSATPSAGVRFMLRHPCPSVLHRFDLVEIYPPENDPFVPDGIKLVKHAACFPGEKIVREGKRFFCLTREGLRLDLGPIKFRAKDGRPLTPWLSDGASSVIPEGYLFVIGDKSPHSYDSRYFGPISRKRVISCPVPLF
ncbi:Peptidase S26, conserved region [Thermodesulfatator indicus DSM 15286]|uniref:Signal peptidase I n=1 Tax=Thermodesulfatator indicus (strain DSM 15286 / JCM 11887 / CIR29812) TaxID=667014 RepID=F8ACL6_THEID|nr:S26 family signal peptidase [Thermodesulfatator indicus]AEH45791.1 Peptidase S26, conserved region [Thermodesulfatator indicus DSM 15286]